MGEEPGHEAPRYPAVRVSVRSRRPLVLVSAVRHALRQAGVERRQVWEFSEAAFEALDSDRLLALCERWVDLRQR